MHLIFFLMTDGKPLSWYLTAIVCLAIAVLTIWLVGRDIYWDSKTKSEFRRLRANAIPICLWTFSEMEWREYSANFMNYQNPNGSAEIQFTEMDFCMREGNRTTRQILFDFNFALTDCRITEKGIKARLRSIKRGRSIPIYKVNDVYVPIPHGKEADAEKIIEAWKKAIADNAGRVSLVTPSDKRLARGGETDF